MNVPILDKRTKEQLRLQLERRIREYTPQWNYTPGDKDAGAAILELFCEMFYQTIDRYNRIPHKLYVEFLNLLGVMEPPPSPAGGFVKFEVGGTSSEPVRVNQGTKVFAKPEDDNIVFETDRKIDATAAVIEDIYYVNTDEGIIERADLSRDIVFFDTSGGENICLNRFAFAQNDVLYLHGKCAIEVRLRQLAGPLQSQTVSLLTDPKYAQWKYRSGTELKAFDRVSASKDIIRLEKEGPERLAAEGGEETGDEERICIYCDVHRDAGTITLEGVGLRSSKELVPAQSLFSDDVMIVQEDGGYAFGRQPSPYGMFYIRSDEVFVKRGSNVLIRLDMSTVVHSDVDEEVKYEFKKNLISKKSAVKITPDDVFIDHVVWEYHNEYGWAALPVKGTVNPFSGEEEGELELRFTVPHDITATVHNAEDGYFIRARIVSIRNYMAMYPQWILPFVKSVQCKWQYQSDVPISYIRSFNSNKTEEIPDTTGITDLGFTVASPMLRHPRSMYIRFDMPVKAMPLSILFKVRGESLPISKISCEVWVRDKFVRVSTIDFTHNLSHTGTMFIYISQEMTSKEFFGESGYWLRLSLSGFRPEVPLAPCIYGMELNTVLAFQQQKADKEVFSTGAFDANKKITLLNNPVLSSELWVDESGSISAEELSEMQAETPDRIKVERDGTALQSAWVKWERISSLSFAGGSERVYALDPLTGEISFGDGARGMVPPRGDMNIKVNYIYGGGTLGNLGAGEVNALLGSIPKITDVYNIMPMGGGTDKPTMQKIENLGNKRLRHQFVPVSTVDFEEIILEKFGRATSVKCFSGVDEKGMHAHGHVCVVVMSGYMEDDTMLLDLCRRIYDFLSERADCNLVADGRLHVVAATAMTIDVEILVKLNDLDYAAETQQELVKGISDLISEVWRSRDIGDQIDLNELYTVVKSNHNVAMITRILAEGRYRSAGYDRLVPIDENFSFPYATVRNGEHTVRISE